jgi:NACHT domain
MAVTVLIAHAKGDEEYVTELAAPLLAAGYAVHHGGTVLVGESIVEEVQKLLNAGAPVVMCGTIRAVGTSWARRVVNAARLANSRNRVFIVAMEEDADTESLALDGKVATWWRNRDKAAADLVTALSRYFPTDEESAARSLSATAEERYRELALETCDLVDLINLPEGDRHLAVRQLELRRLYVALRVRPLAEKRAEKDARPATRLIEIEQQRLDRAEDGPAEEPDTGRTPLGTRLADTRRLVVLGDPGSGKSTLLRWIATAYLLRLSRDPDWRELPDVASLPDEDWLPVLIRCRDLKPENIGGSLDDILRHTLRQQEMTEAECDSLRDLLRVRLREGTALVLLDGLDEVSDPLLRARLCEQLERIATAYPRAPIVTTCRIVGYREMGYRIGRGFAHVTIDDLSPAEKDDFAARWCGVTEPPERRESAFADLTVDIHSTPRIEALTGNPMLLTTMALVKRKVGKLPSRRADLYWEAVQVLLNWRREVDLPLAAREALPQLEYLAYAMCDRAVQQLREDEILAVLRSMRDEYPQIHAVHAHSPEEFLHLVESRTGVLAATGEVRHQGRPVPVYEFRHLTFQEYLAARGLVEGHFPGHDPGRSLAERLAPLARRTERFAFGVRVVESWREAIRLCVASCNDADVDDALLAILSVDAPEQPATRFARASLALECLTDEPNASDAVAEQIIRTSVHLVVPKRDFWIGATVRALWWTRLRDLLLRCVTPMFTGDWSRDCDLITLVYPESLPVGSLRLDNLAATIRSDDPDARLVAAVTMLVTTFPDVGSRYSLSDYIRSGAIGALTACLAEARPFPLIGAWALGRIYTNDPLEHALAPVSLVRDCCRRVNDPDTDDVVVRFLLWILGEPRNLDNETLPASSSAIVNWLTRSVHLADRAFAFLRETGYPELSTVYARCARHPSPAMRAAIAARAVYEPGELTSLLLDLAEDVDETVRATALRSLITFEPDVLTADEESVAALRRIAMSTMAGADEWAGFVGAMLGSVTGVSGAHEYIAGRLGASDRITRTDTLERLMWILGEDHRRLLSRDGDGALPYDDPVEVVTDDVVRDKARLLGTTTQTVRARYERLADQFGLRLAWRRR